MHQPSKPSNTQTKKRGRPKGKGNKTASGSFYSHQNKDGSTYESYHFCYRDRSGKLRKTSCGCKGKGAAARVMAEGGAQWWEIVAFLKSNGSKSPF